MEPVCPGILAPGANAHRPVVIYRIPHHRFLDGVDGISHVPGEPQYERALLCDPGGASSLGHYRAFGLGFRYKDSRLSRQILILGRNHARPARPLSTLRGVDCSTATQAHFRMAGQPFRAGLDTRWVHTKRFQTSHLPLPGFAWRTRFTVSKSDVIRGWCGHFSRLYFRRSSIESYLNLICTCHL
jgi:hypothetical protein